MIIIIHQFSSFQQQCSLKNEQNLDWCLNRLDSLNKHGEEGRKGEEN